MKNIYTGKNEPKKISLQSYIHSLGCKSYFRSFFYFASRFLVKVTLMGVPLSAKMRRYSAINNVDLPNNSVAFAATNAYVPIRNITGNSLLALYIDRGVISARCPEDRYDFRGDAVVMG